MSASTPSSRAKLRIKVADLADVPAIQEIYAHYVINSTSSFEEEAPTVAEMTARWQKLKVMGMPYLVAMLGKRVAGYAYGGPFRERRASFTPSRASDSAMASPIPRLAPVRMAVLPVREMLIATETQPTSIHFLAAGHA